MTSDRPSPAAPGGFATTLRATSHAALLTGFLVGVVDFVTIATDPLTKLATSDLVLSGAQGCALYIGFFLVVGLVLSPIVHLGFKSTPLGTRARHAFGMVLAVGVFMEMYWWTRKFVFYGVPATSPERMFSAVVMAMASYAIAVLIARAFATRGKVFKGSVEGAAWLTLLLGCGGLLFAAEPPSERGAINERNADLPNVLLVVVDALRADVIGAYGNERVQTPVMDQLAADGVVFENAFAQAPYTWTSFGSILTGKYPRRHGLMKMKPGVRMMPNRTLALHLKEAARRDGGPELQPEDFTSGTFMTGTLSQGSGLMEGFDVYFEALVGHERVDFEVPWSRYRSDLVLLKFKNKIGQKFDSGLVVSTAREWLRENRGKRFAAMVHLYSTHTPYDPLPEFKELYVDPAYDGPLSAFYAEHRYAIEAGEYKPTAADVEQVRNLYYGGVTQADAAIGDVLEELRLAGALDNTLVVITSDHGESLGDDVLYGQPLWEHNWMFESNLRVPLIMSWPNGLAKGVVVGDIVETVDIVPTICDLMGLVDPDETAEIEQLEASAGAEAGDEIRRMWVDGHSLLPLVEAAAGRPTARVGDEWDGFAFAENGPYLSIRDARWKLVVPRDGLFGEAWTASLEIPDMVGEQPKREEIVALSMRPRLFDLQADPFERRDLIRSTDAAHVAERERLLERLRTWSDQMPMPHMEVDLSGRDAENQQLLEELGYTGEEDEENPADRLGGVKDEPESAPE